MLFMGSQNASMSYLDKYRDVETPDPDPSSSVDRTNLRNIALALTGFYILVSLVSVAFYPPYSFLALVFPVVILMMTFCACRMRNKDTFWPCILMASLGLLLKIVACIVFISIFGFSGDTVVNPKPVLHKSRQPSSMVSDMRALFFYILTAVELFLLVLTCCVQWHLIAFKRCMENN